MAVLHNRISQKELKERLYQETEPRTTISFYHYFPISDPAKFRDELYKALDALKVFGRIYVAHEGINAQLSVPQSNYSALKDHLHSIQPLEGVRLNIAVDDDGKSFWVLKIKVRDKIVADGITDPAFSMENKGRYVNAGQMNELMNDPDTVVIDMRNHYEYEVGHFENALEIPSDTFRQQLPMAVDMMKEKKDKNIIMYCTGGIRCEKASAYMLHHGFKNVFHLEGGIINYAKQIKEEGLQSKFIGKNFVFDDRLGEKITEDIIAHCHQCGKPADTHTNCVNSGCHLLFIQCAECAAKYEGCCSQECLDVIHLPEEDQKKIRAGIDKGRNIFNKSKAKLRRRIDMNKNLLLLIIFFLPAFIACKSKANPAEKQVEVKDSTKGYEIDPSIEKKVRAQSSSASKDTTIALGMFEVTMYEDGRKRDIPMLTGVVVPHYSMMMMKTGDSIVFVFPTLFGGSPGLAITFVRDTCFVQLSVSPRSAGPIFRLHPDSAYQRGVIVGGKSHVIVSRSPFEEGDKLIYGYVEYEGDDYFSQISKGDQLRSSDYKGYFVVSPKLVADLR